MNTQPIFKLQGEYLVSGDKQIKASPEFIEQCGGKEIEHVEGVTFRLAGSCNGKPCECESTYEWSQCVNRDLNITVAYPITADKPVEDEEDIWQDAHTLIMGEIGSYSNSLLTTISSRVTERLKQHFTIQRKGAQ